ncbi:hypothetical protein PHYC_03830 [Phycisphaerales bacterium]|nr:hypothetical protein PHYC_03830 [Phycisphaerales bacterium]
MRIHGRLDRLEKAAAGGPCRECGGETPGVAVVCSPPAASLLDLPRDQAAEQPGDRCPRCGRVLVLRLAPPPRGTE